MSNVKVTILFGFSERPQPNNNPSGTCPAPFGSYAINDGDCSRFIMCQEGLSTIMTCPLGLVFNDQTQACDWPANVPQCHPAGILKSYNLSIIRFV